MNFREFLNEKMEVVIYMGKDKNDKNPIQLKQNTRIGVEVEIQAKDDNFGQLSTKEWKAITTTGANVQGHYLFARMEDKAIAYSGELGMMKGNKWAYDIIAETLTLEQEGGVKIVMPKADAILMKKTMKKKGDSFTFQNHTIVMSPNFITVNDKYLSGYKHWKDVLKAIPRK